MKLLGIVVLFHPKKDEVIRNISSYLSGLDALILWDNTPDGGGNIEEIEKSLPSGRVIRMGYGRNVGLGKAYNDAAKYALENGFTHLLTMDQDSRFENSSFGDYCRIVSAHAEADSSVYSPNYRQYTGLTRPVQDMVAEVDYCQSSGSLMSVEIFRRGVFFLEELIAYWVDYEFLHRARKSGSHVYSVDNVVLNHGAGYQRSTRKFLWKTVYPNEYPPLNTYLMMRNYFYLLKKENFQAGKGFCRYYLFKRSVFIFCYESDKWRKYKAIALGIYDGMRMNLKRDIRVFE